MRAFEQRRSKRRVGFALAAGIALATVAAPAPVATAANGAAVDEYVLTPPGVSKQTITASPASASPEERRTAPRPAVLSAEAPQRSTLAAALGLLGGVSPALLVALAVTLACLLVSLLAARRRGAAA